jgi:SAM-dependent methyltransferase
MGSISAPIGDSWGEDDNARRYDAYAREYPGYQEASRDLIALALPSGDAGIADAAVLDLACGTGATTREILAVLGRDGKVTGADQSAAMLGVAGRSVADPRVTWIQARAESVDRHVTGLVDVVICNSAIWQTDVAATALAVRAVLKAGGRFAFNVPASLLGDRDQQRSREPYPSLLREMQAIAARDYGWVPAGQPPGRAGQRLTQESICRFLTAAGFAVEQVTEVSHLDSASSQRAWLSIPIFTRFGLDGLPYEDRMHILDQAYEQLGPGQTEPTEWVVFAARVQ